MKRILVLCNGNSARSQMAQAYLQHFAGNRAEVYSAGIKPKGVNPLAVQVMAEDGIDISQHTSNLVDDYVNLPFDVVITVCDRAREQCPFFPHAGKQIHHSFPEPSHMEGKDKLTAFREVRDLIKAYSREFVDSQCSSQSIAQYYMAHHIENARPGDKPAVIDLLERSQLLTDDLPADLSDFLIAREQDKSVGVAGIERFDQVGLLRSVAVAPDSQGKQIGAQLISQLLHTAKATGLKELYLITTTAQGYFERHGFQSIDRLDVPPAIQATQQFSGLCPASAVVMSRML